MTTTTAAGAATASADRLASGKPAGVVAEQVMRLRRLGERRPGRHDPGGEQAAMIADAEATP